jgi:hypothetical protein
MITALRDASPTVMLTPRAAKTVRASDTYTEDGKCDELLYIVTVEMISLAASTSSMYHSMGTTLS